MKREIERLLPGWKSSGRGKKPLLLRGARHVGKTFTLRRFGEENYHNTVYLNFEDDPAYGKFFSGRTDPETLLAEISKHFDTTIMPGRTLLVFDEIQNFPGALMLLKYFCEDAPEYDVAAVQSLPGSHPFEKDFTFPADIVTEKMMFPMNFKEFLQQSDKADLTEAIEDCFAGDIPIDKPLHESLLALHSEYMVVGGMPLAVSNYFQRSRELNYAEVQKLVLDNYTADMKKSLDRRHSSKAISTYESITAQLSKGNTKFLYKLVADGARGNLFGKAIDWLAASGMVLKSVKLSQQTALPEKPPGGGAQPASNTYPDGNTAPSGLVINPSAFRLYMNDIGLASYKAGLTAANMSYFDGAALNGLAENYAACCLTGSGYKLNYWQSESKAAIGFVIMQDGKAIPVEVKTGYGTRSYSLLSYIKRFRPEYAIRICTQNFGFRDGIKTVPLYAAHLI